MPGLSAGARAPPGLRHDTGCSANTTSWARSRASLSWLDSFTHVLPGTAAGSPVGQLVGVDPGAPGATPGLLAALSCDRALVTVSAHVVLLPLAPW